MLNSLRNSAGSWVVKILLGLLIASFALWGIDGIFMGGAQRHVAQVGEREISTAEYEQTYRNQVGLISARLGRQLTDREARQFGIGQNVLQSLISSTAIDLHAQSLGLGISNDAIVASIQNEPAFRGSGDTFDRSRFDEVLRNMGLSEQGFVARQREDLIREQVAGALSEAAYVPQTMLDALYHHRNDERVLNYFVVAPETAGEIAQPDEAALTTYYEANKNRYRAPEYRKVGLLTLTPEAIRDTVALTDEQLKVQFEATKDQYSRPERRTIQQLVFNDMEAARAAAERLANGEDFVALGKELGMKESDIDLGPFTQSGFANRDVAEAAFKLEKGQVSEPIDSFTTMIIKVTEIEPGEQKTFEDVKEEVRAALARDKAREEIQNLYDAIEDARAGGANLQEAAQKLNLPYAEHTFDRQGRDQSETPVGAVAQAPAAVNLAFESDVGVENNPVPSGDGFVFVDVLEVIPDRQKAFEEVREQVKTQWIEEETRKAVRAKATELAEKAKGGATLEEVAGEIGASVSTTPAVKRDGAPEGLPRTAVSLGFSLPDKGIGNVEMADRKAQAVIQVAEVRKAPPMEEAQAETLRTELRQTMGVDILTQYVGGLQADYGVQINNQALSALSIQ
ncbi:MAG: SurA N-terminal domain-containing protein [Rhodomicrobiaceae bacterium]